MEQEFYEDKKDQIHEGSDGSVLSLGNILNECSAEEIRFMMDILGHNVDASEEMETRNFQILLSGAHHLSISDARAIVEEALKEHELDRNLPGELRARMQYVAAHSDDEVISDGITVGFETKCIASIFKYSSPYPDVRANTDNYDDGAESCETIRAYLVGIIWVGIGSFVNQFFEVRLPSISLSSALLQLFAVPTGYALALILPDWGFNFMGKRHSLNPGPWTYKEQSLVTIMFGITASLAYVDSQILVQKMPMFYGNEWATQGFQICLVLSTQYLGFGIAGIFRNLLVYPTQNLWMNNFPNLALNKAFLSPDDRRPVNGWTLTRWQFFAIVFGAIFVYEWIPQVLMGFLSTFNWMTWIAPQNFNLAAITGSADGLAINPISTFDWVNIGFYSPLQTPFFSFANVMIGGFVSGLIIIAVYWTNMYYTGYLPINSNHLFTNTGVQFTVQEILTNNVLDEAKYQAYSPPYYSAANLVIYGSFFAGYTCIYVTSLLYDWDVMVQSAKDLFKGVVGKGKGIKDYNDAHSRMMQKYPETPQWWFIIVLLCALGLAIATLKAWPTETPVWGLFMALGLSIVFLIPIGILWSRTNNLFSINVLTELLIGYAKPGHGTAMMLVKAYGVNTNLQAMYFMNDLKYGHYAKIPPRSSFRAQMIATFVAAMVVWGVTQFQLHSVKDICTQKLAHTSKFTCPNEFTYFSASVIWGVIGPKRIFDGQYPILKWCFLIGCFIPIPLFAFRYFFPKWRKYVLHLEPNAMILGVLSIWAPFNLSYFVSGFYVNIFFMYYIRNRYTKWFEKYNYTLAAALTAGSALATFIIFFAVQYNPKSINWWGNNVPYNGIDGSGAARLPIPDIGFFGPAPGDYVY